MPTSNYLLICSEHAILKERHEKKIFQVQEFQIAQGATSRDSTCPQQIQPVRGKWAIAYF